MSITLIIQAIIAVFKFPGVMSSFIRLISDSPEEQRRDIVNIIQNESMKYKESGRPKW